MTGRRPIAAGERAAALHLIAKLTPWQRFAMTYLGLLLLEHHVAPNEANDVEIRSLRKLLRAGREFAMPSRH